MANKNFIVKNGLTVGGVDIISSSGVLTQSLITTVPAATVATTQAVGNSSTLIANTAYVRGEIDALIDSAPGTLNTLDELAAAINDDAAFNTTLTNAVALKSPLASPTFTGNVSFPDDTIDLAHMSVNSIDSDQYVDGSIDLAHMSANSIDSAQYVDGSIDLAHMSADSIDSTQYVDGSIDTAHIAASQITLAKMATNSIDSDQYVDGSIDLAHMSANSIDSTQYVDGSIDNAHLSADVITGAKIADDQIDSEHYVDGSIDAAHLAPAQTNITSVGTLTSFRSTGIDDNADALAMTIDSSENIGIGMTPGHKFDIKSAGAGSWPFRIFNSQDSDMSVGFYESSSGDGYNAMLYMQDGAGNLDVKLSTNGPSWFNGGNLGIGTSSPDYKLEVEADFATNVPGIVVNHTSASASWPQGVHVLAPINAGTELAGISVGTEWDSRNAAKLGFYYAGDASTSNLLTLGFHGVDRAMTISAAGNVGIGKGTTVGGYTLDVDGDINFTGTLREDGSAFVGGSTTLTGLTTATVSSSNPATNTNPSAVGHLWVNSTTGEVYICTDATSGANLWQNIGDGSGGISTATGGNTIASVTISSQAYRVHVFTSSGTFTCGTLGDIDILMVAGGGSGGVRHGGGGGAGGLIEITDTTFTSGDYICTVGAGGARKVGNGAGVDGANSTIVCSARSVSITATGGGGGGGYGVTTGRDGGSGGAAGPYFNNAANGLGQATQGSPSMTGLTGGTGAGFGYDGGGNPGNHAAGGGGGAGGLGGNSINESGGEDSDTGGLGGVGRQNNIDGNNYYYAGGGGGGSRRAFHGGAGSHGGGGGNAENLHSGTHGVGGTGARNAGANADDDVAGSAGANTGSGGGGIAQNGVEGYPSDSESGAGGSGIIIIRYEV